LRTKELIVVSTVSNRAMRIRVGSGFRSARNRHQNNRKETPMTPNRRRWMEPRVLGAIFVAALALWAFVEIADEMLEGETHAVDTAILTWFRSAADLSDPIGPRWLEEAMRDITALGGTSVLVLIVLAAVGLLLLRRAWGDAMFVLVATIGGTLVSTLLKNSFDRPRPDLVPHGAYVYTASFPSGHAMLSAVVYLTLAALLVRLVQGKRAKAYLLAVATLLCVLIGTSRVYLGVHWPSDVLAGWVVGAAWALGCWSVAQAVKPGRPAPPEERSRP